MAQINSSHDSRMHTGPGDHDVGAAWTYHKEDKHMQTILSCSSTSKAAGAARETAMRGLIGSFNRICMAGFVEARGDALIRAMEDILRSENTDATTAELTLACRILGRLALAIAEDRLYLGLPDIIKDTAPLLRYHAQHVQEGPGGVACSSRPACAALETLAVLAICGRHTNDPDIEAAIVEDSGSRLGLLDWIWSTAGLDRDERNVVQSDAGAAAAPVVAATSLVAWTVVLTTLAPHKIARHGERRGNRLVEIAMSEHTPDALRAAAHDAVALLSEYCGADVPEFAALRAHAQSGGGVSSVTAAGAVSSKPTDLTKFVVLPQARALLRLETQSHRVLFRFFRHILGAGLEPHFQHMLMHCIFPLTRKELHTHCQEEEVPTAEFDDDPRPAATWRNPRKSRSANRRDNQLSARAHFALRKNGRAKKESMCFHSDD